ncbi:hypothetical protein Hdeb2414_s0009g00311711 [Helianthus debilis subsp. tardiflorus]
MVMMANVRVAAYPFVFLFGLHFVECSGHESRWCYGEDREDDEDDAFDFIREVVIVLSSDGSGRSFEGLTSRSLRAGPAEGVVHEPVNEPVDDDVEVPVETAAQLETRRKTKADKPEGKGKRAEETATKTPRKRLHTLRVLDYVVVSDTLSGLGA